ncbi:protein-L-isoaspartate O-methyltransferase [Pisolithus orientalis]|uniref:protein-L-isoaspartate O-methyltransferase n=1 Tax=Pisolithus orientalis TaxID=936130 RepID=UPI002224D56F|nr:protein-L-isoaspartate O-methyltransferase [Pisolithus orientalis]KAI6000320.1 protein-L-isoaspartate O-methyltransferase [Pisolithus orientalis]
MAWRCSGRSNNEPIRNLARQSILALDRVTDAMAKVNTVNRTPYLWPSNAYQDSPQFVFFFLPRTFHSLGDNTLPYVHPGATVVIVGSGSGYLAVVLHHLVSPMHSSDNPNLPQGKVIGIDHIPDVAERSKYNLENDGLGAGLTVRSN